MLNSQVWKCIDVKEVFLLQAAVKHKSCWWEKVLLLRRWSPRCKCMLTANAFCKWFLIKPRAGCVVLFFDHHPVSHHYSAKGVDYFFHRPEISNKFTCFPVWKNQYMSSAVDLIWCLILRELMITSGCPALISQLIGVPLGHMAATHVHNRAPPGPDAGGACCNVCRWPEGKGQMAVNTHQSWN